MYQRNDYIMKQIALLSQCLTRILFKDKKDILPLSQKEIKTMDGSKEQLKKLILDGKINEGENLLFDWIEGKPDAMNLECAIYFFTEVAKQPESFLKASSYSMEEVEEGIEAVEKVYGVRDSFVFERTGDKND